MEKYIGFILLIPLVISSVIVSIMTIKNRKTENEIYEQRKEYYKLMIEEQKIKINAIQNKINEIQNNENKEEIKRRPGRPKKEEEK